jgi:hypothetical protein
MSDSTVVYYRYVDYSKTGNAIQELRYCKGKWELLSRLEDGSESSKPLSHDEAKDWESVLCETDVLISTDDSWMIRKILRDFGGTNRILDAKTSKKVDFLPEQWEIVGVKQIADYLAPSVGDLYLFHGEGTWIEVSRFLFYDNEFVGDSKDYFHVTVLDEQEASQFLIDHDLDFPKELIHLSPECFSPGFVKSQEKPKEVKPSKDSNDTTDKKVGRKPRNSQERSRKELLVSKLLEHHRYGTKDLDQKPIKLGQFEKDCSMSKTTASRAFVDLELTYRKYVKICEDYQDLKLFLMKLDKPFRDYREKTNLQESIDIRGESDVQDDE